MSVRIDERVPRVSFLQLETKLVFVTREIGAVSCKGELKTKARRFLEIDSQRDENKWEKERWEGRGEGEGNEGSSVSMFVRRMPTVWFRSSRSMRVTAAWNRWLALAHVTWASRGSGQICRQTTLLAARTTGFTLYHWSSLAHSSCWT